MKTQWNLISNQTTFEYNKFLHCIILRIIIMQTSMKEEIRITSDCHWEGMSWDELKKNLKLIPSIKPI